MLALILWCDYFDQVDVFLTMKFSQDVLLDTYNVLLHIR
jgi:hypothetical protein